MSIRGQTALEFMTTYSFAFVMIGIAMLLGAVIASSVGSNIQYYSSCSIQPLMQCEEAIMAYNSLAHTANYTILFRNQISYLLLFQSNAINITTTNIGSYSKIYTKGSCHPSLVGIGAQVVCNVSISGTYFPSLGTDITTPFVINYSICPNSNTLQCYPGVYTSTGFSSESLDPPTTNLFRFGLVSNNGIVEIDGDPYFGGTTIYLTGGNYSVYAQPNSGHSFSSWQWSGGSGSTITPSGSRNATLVLKSDGNVVAVFH